MWKIEYLKKALDDLKKLDYSQRLQVVKAINKVAQNPLSKAEGGYGKPLGNRNTSQLSGYFKIKLKKLGLRVVYKLLFEDGIMRVVIISARADEEVYINAQKRIKNN